MTTSNTDADSRAALDQRYRVRSVDRALQVLDVLAEANGGLGVSAIARRVADMLSGPVALPAGTGMMSK